MSKMRTETHLDGQCRLRDRRRGWVIAALMVLLSPVEVTAQLKVERLFPPAVSVSSESSIKVEGTFPKWPPKIVCDRDDVRVTAQEESGSLKIVVADAAPLGIAWIRLYDDAAASAEIPLLIQRDPIQLESEPNDQLSGSSQPISLPAVIAGRLAKSGDVDAFRVQLKAGETFIASLRGNEILGSPMDGVLQLVDQRGNVIAQSDDERGIDPQIVYWCEDDFDAIIRTFAFPETPTSTIGFAGGATFVYTLQLTTGPWMDHALPLMISESGKEFLMPVGWNLSADQTLKPTWAPNSLTSSLTGVSGWQWHDRAPDNATYLFESSLRRNVDEGATSSNANEPVVSLPIVFSGRLQEAGETDAFSFAAQAGKRYRASVHARKFGLEVDSVLRFIDVQSGEVLKENDDRSRSQYDAAIEYSCKADQTIELQVSDLVENHGLRAAYSVLVEQIQPSTKLQMSTDRYVLESGQSTEVVVAVNRTDGDASKIRIEAVDLPEGIVCDVAESMPEGDSSKTVKMTLKSAGANPIHGSFGIVGHRLNDQGDAIGEPIVATYLANKRFHRSNLWLTVKVKTE